MTAARGIASAIASAIILVSMHRAHASGDNERAIALAQEARTAYERGRWADALALFRVAEGIAHSPVFGLHVARCLHKLGRLVEARDAYRAVTAQVLAPTASEPFRKAQADARAELSALDGAVPRVVVTFATRVPDLRITIDGKPVARPAQGGVEAARELAIDPGHHVIAATTAGAGAATLALDVRLGDPARRLVLDQPPTRRGSPWPGLVVGGLGVATLGVGAVTGITAIVKTRALRARCSDGICPLSLESEQRTAHRYASVSTGAFVTGGVLAAAGAVLYIIRPWGTRVPGDLTLHVAPGAIGAAGRF